MKILFLICLLFAVCLCQTNINIYNGASSNGGSTCGGNKPTTPTPTTTPSCPRQRFNVINPFYNGSLDRIINGTRSGLIYEMWAEVRRRNPIFPEYVSTSLVTGNFKQDVSDLILKGLQDLALEPYTANPTNIGLGLKFSINPFPYVSESNRFFYSNLPRTTAQSNGACAGFPACIANGWCSNLEVQQIADYSINNGNVPVVITYNAGSSRIFDSEAMKQQLIAKGVKSVTLNTIPASNFYVDMFNYAVKISSINPLTEINFIQAVPAVSLQQCMNFPSGTQLSLTTWTLPNFQSGFIFNPNVDTFYYDAFNQILKQFIDEHYICKLLVKYSGYCNDLKNPFWTSPQNYCAKSNWSELPDC